MRKLIVGSFLMLVSGLCAMAQVANLASLKVSDEITPAGGVAQVKVMLTEPKPIVRTSLFADFSDAYFDEFLGISAVDGLTGVAQYRTGHMRFVLSDAASATPELDYPILMMAVKTRATLPVGATTPVSLDLNQTTMVGLTGAYAEEAQPGSVTTGGTLFISNVLPGGGTLRAGDKFRVLGGGFTKALQVRCEGAKLVSVSPNEFQMEAKVPLRLDGLRIVARVDKELVTYYSYLRGTKSAPSVNGALAGMVPVFSAGTALEAYAPLAGFTGYVSAVGLQNPTDKGNNIEISAVSLFGQVLAKAVVKLSPRQNVLLTAEELFGAALPMGSVAVKAESVVPFQMTAAHVSGDGSVVAAPFISIARAGVF